MGLKTYALRLDEDVTERIKKALESYGDPDLNLSFVMRKYLRDLDEALPHLRKSDRSLMNNLAFWGMMLKQAGRTAQFENLMRGEPIVERAQAEIDDKKIYKKRKKGKED
ncbi:MAG: hypothetical protein ACOYVJ_13000 [Nitrospirota bacterium]